MHYVEIMRALRRDYAHIPHAFRKHPASIPRAFHEALRKHYASITQALRKALRKHDAIVAQAPQAGGKLVALRASAPLRRTPALRQHGAMLQAPNCTRA